MLVHILPLGNRDQTGEFSEKNEFASRNLPIPNFSAYNSSKWGHILSSLISLCTPFDLTLEVLLIKTYLVKVYKNNFKILDLGSIRVPTGQ